MKRKVTKYAVIIISILLAELTHEYIQLMFAGWVKQSQFGLYISVLLSMLVAVLVFYPAFHLIETYLKFASKKYVQGSKKIGKDSFLGIIIGFGLALLLLFIGFCEIWYNQNPLAHLFY
jgi:hypothetical protein